MEPFLMSGDIVLAHGDGLISKTIRFAERIRGRGGDNWNHVAILDRKIDGVWYVLQAEAKGVTNDKTLASVGSYAIVTLPHYINRLDVLEFARKQVGSKYGFVSILSCIVDIVIPDSICLRKSNTWICSGLVAASLMYAGWEPAWTWARRDIYTIMPSELAVELMC